MATANLNNDAEQIITGNENIVIRKVDRTVPGGRTLDVTGFEPKVIPGGHVIIKETATGNYKPFPATDATIANVATLGTVVPGSAYTNGTYTNVPLKGGTGKGALATIVVASNVVSSVTKTKGGEGYTVGDALSADNSYMGGTGTGFSVPVATLTTAAAVYGALPTGHTYEGLLIASIPVEKPFAGIMIAGGSNLTASTYPISPILSAFKTACPFIQDYAD